MRKFFKEFKDFALQGNVMALAVGLIIGAAFQGIVASLTDNIISPVIGLFVGQNFDTLYIDIAGATLYYGAFITSIINFVILAFVVFLMVKGINKMMSRKRQDEQAPVDTKACPHCLTQVPLQATRCPACTSDISS